MFYINYSCMSRILLYLTIFLHSWILNFLSCSINRFQIKSMHPKNTINVIFECIWFRKNWILYILQISHSTYDYCNINLIEHVYSECTLEECCRSCVSAMPEPESAVSLAHDDIFIALGVRASRRSTAVIVSPTCRNK